MINKLINYFDFFFNKIKNLENWILFCVLGVYLPVTILVYRWLTICLQIPFLFKEFSFFSVNNLFWEPVIFCYISSIFFCFFLYKKKTCYHINVFLKSDPLFCFYSKLIKLEFFLCENKIIAFLLLLFYYYLYLFVSFKGSFFEAFFLSFRQLVFSYFAFKNFFESECLKEESLYNFHLLSFYKQFVCYHEKLQIEENKINLILFYTLNVLFFIFFFRENRVIKLEIQSYKDDCELLLSSLKEKKNYYQLIIEKEKLFTFEKRQPFFFFLALEVFTSFLKKCEMFQKSLKDQGAKPYS